MAGDRRWTRRAKRKGVGMGLGHRMGKLLTWGTGAIATLGMVGAIPLHAYGDDAIYDDAVYIDGAGATSLAPLFDAYRDAYAVYSDTPVSYLGIGSRDGIRNLLSGTVDFIGSDLPLTDGEVAQISDGAISIPIAVSAIALAYNLPDVPDLKLSRTTSADIFLGKITTWNDPRIVADNPGVELPELPIRLVVRADASGESLILVEHLDRINSEIGDRLGESLSPTWIGKVDLARGNEGMVHEIQRLKGSLGYVDYAYTLNRDLQMVSVQNPSGEFVPPSISNAAQALNSVVAMGINEDSLYPEIGYPIVDVKWLALYRNYTDEETAVAVKQLITWMLDKGQTLNPEMGYLPLPELVARRAQEIIQTDVGVSPEARQLPLLPEFGLELNH